jgi:hypothetical protein
MAVLLLDDTLSIEIYYECDDCDWEDNITIRVREDCPPEERLLRMEETHIFLTRAQAQALAEALLAAAAASREDVSPGDQGR